MEEAVLFERSLDDVRGMISHAKLIESDLLPLSQIVRQELMSQQLVAIAFKFIMYKLMLTTKVHYCIVVTFVG